MKSSSIGMPSDSLLHLSSLKRLCMGSGLEDMDEEAEGELQNENNPTTISTDMTLGTDRNNRDSREDTRALLPSRTDSPELPRHSVNLSRSSYDHQGSDDSHTRLIDVLRGEAPAYETIDLDATVEPAPVYTPRNPQPVRMSGFFSRFMSHRGNSSTTNELAILSPISDSQNSTLSPSHSRESSLQPGISGVAPASLPDSSRRSHVGRSHRSGSTTGSVFTLFSKTVSGNYDDVPMTSPSMISLNSISPPLTHTATRTEFSFPRTGPTSEQVKFLSSKDTFGRFGVPYGPDALAFAASSSRPDLPPDFDSAHRSSISDQSPIPDDGTTPSLRSPMSTGRVSTDAGSDREEPPFPTEPSPDLTDQPPPSRRNSGLNLEVDTVTSPLQNSLPKQKSTPNLGMGHPSLLKSALKSKSIANIQSDVEGNLPPRSASAAGSYLTVESFQTAHETVGGSAPLWPVPQIMVQLPSNNPSMVNLVEGSSSETEEFFDGEEGAEGNRGEGVNGRGNKTSGAASLNPKGPQNTHTYSMSSDSDTGSDNESEAETHSNHTEVDKTLVTADLETSHMHEGTDVTLTLEKVAVALKASSPDLTKTGA